MIASYYRHLVAGHLGKADIRMDGERPFDLVIKDPRTFERVVKKHSVGLGESYMDDWWECQALDQFFERAFATQLGMQKLPFWNRLERLKASLVNLQSRVRASIVCDVHYDLGNELYIPMLGPSMVYTCGYWDHARTLEEAQEHKLDMVCRKMGLRPGMRVLDIGCGFGSLLKHAATHYGVTGVGISLSKRQLEYAKEDCKHLPIEFLYCDYRELKAEPFDRIISIGMFEAVGPKNHRGFMQAADRYLKDDGAMLLHTMGNNTTRFPVGHFIDKYIFPNGQIPSLGEIARAAEGHFIVEDLHNIGPDYDKTLMAWHANFLRSWPELQKRHGQKYDQRFKRMWEFYLLSFAGGFRARHWQLWQLALTKPGCKLQGLAEARLRS